MKKYTTTLRDRTDYKLAIDWCAKVFPMNTVIPIHDRKSWWDKRARERSFPKRWNYSIDIEIDEWYSTTTYVPPTMTIIRKFEFINKDDFSLFTMTWDCE